MEAGKTHAVAIVISATKRSKSALRSFVKQHACPATGEHRLPCKGYVIDHTIPLACGGADDPTNMQWQTIHEAKAKDRWERNGCKKSSITDQPKNGI